MVSPSPAALAIVRRGATDECTHYGDLAVTAGGEVVASVGDPHRLILPRSSLKPLQAAALAEAGLQLPPHLLAITCASHSGEDMHVAAVGELLARFDFTDKDLDNTPSLPLDVQAARDWVNAGRGPVSLTQNCSGKHAGMLAACRQLGFDHAGYRDPRHPVQRLIADYLQRRYPAAAAPPEVDGCGAPAFLLTLADLASAFGALASGGHRIGAAMSTYPQLVGGTGRFDTNLMAAVPGLVVKGGAEGVLAVGLADGRGIACKVSDGAHRGAIAAVSQVLCALGVDPASVAKVSSQPVLGAGQVVGAVLPAFEIEV